MIRLFRSIVSALSYRRRISLLALCCFLLSACSAISSPEPITVSSNSQDSYYQGPPAVELSSIQRRRLAGRVLEYYDSKLPLAAAESSYVQKLTLAKDILEGGATERFRYGVYLSNRLHAFGLASGDIRLHSGLLDVLSSQDELLALLGCLQEHIRRGHAEEAVEQAYNAAIKETPAFAEALRSPPFEEAAIRAVADRTTLYRFSLEQLSQCDLGAVAQLKKVGLDPKATLALLERLKRFEGTGDIEDTEYDISKTHPMAAARQRLVAKELGVPIAADPLADTQLARANGETVEDTEVSTDIDDEDGASTAIEEDTELSASMSTSVDSNGTTIKSATLKSPTRATTRNAEDDSLDAVSKQVDAKDDKSEITTAKINAPKIEEESLIATAERPEALQPAEAEPLEDAAIADEDTATAPELDLEQEPEPEPTRISEPTPEPVVTLANGWYVQLSADTERATAERRQRAASGRNYNAAIQEAVIRGVRYYRVLVGPHQSIEQAQQVKAQLAESGLADGKPFVRRFPE